MENEKIDFILKRYDIRINLPSDYKNKSGLE